MSKILFLRNFREDQRTSMEVYADQLLESISGADTGHVINSFTPEIRYWGGKSAGSWAMRFARYLDYSRQLKNYDADVFHIAEHGYAHLLKQLPPHKTIVTVHDVIPFLRYRGLIRGVEPGSRPRLSEYSLGYLKNAAHLIAISNNTRNDLVQYCGCQAEKISVVYPGIRQKDPGEKLSKLRCRESLGLPALPVKLVLVTGQDFYKNLESSIHTFNLLLARHPDVGLVHLGANSTEWKKAKIQCHKPQSIFEFPAMDHTSLGVLYTAVDCVLFPSWYEGFGLPPVEAMSCGTPSVTSNAASLPEATGSAAITTDPDDIKGLCDALEKLLFNDTVRESCIVRGIRHAEKLTWNRCSEGTLEVYSRVLDQNRKPGLN